MSSKAKENVKSWAGISVFKARLDNTLKKISSDCNEDIQA